MHVIDSLAIGGKERMAVDLANAASAKGCHVSMCVTRCEADLAAGLDQQVRLHVLKRRSTFDVRGMLHFLKALKLEKPEVLHIHGRSSFSFVVFLKSLGMIRQPLIFHDHYGVEMDFSVPLWMKCWAKRYAAVYVGVYERLTAWAEKAGFAKDRVRIFGNAIDLGRLESAEPVDLRKALDIPAGRRLFIAVCDLRPEKGVDVLLDAIAQLKPADCVFVIAGGQSHPAYADQCRRKAQEGGLENKVIFLGKREDAPGLLKNADFAVMPSLSESGPLVLIEYLAAGLPFVSSLVGDIACRTAKRFPDRFVPPGRPDLLAGKIEQLLACSLQELRRLREEESEFAREEFDLRKKIDEWIHLYQQAAASAHA
jgi:glycosyltransferase involved in cell wall biosynthesis